MASRVLETQRYCLVAFTGVASGSASNGCGSPSKSILESLNESGDSEDCDGKCYDSDEYDAAMKQFEAEVGLEELQKKQDAAKKVFMTSKGDDRDKAFVDPLTLASKDPQAIGAQDNPPSAANASNDDLPQIHAGTRPSQPSILEDRPPEDFVTPVDKSHV
jgi:hypothetical protein